MPATPNVLLCCVGTSAVPAPGRPPGQQYMGPNGKVKEMAKGSTKLQAVCQLDRGSHRVVMDLVIVLCHCYLHYCIPKEFGNTIMMQFA